MKHVRKFLIPLLVALFCYLLLWPIAMEPKAWTPPDAPEMVNEYASNDKLLAMEKIALPQGHGPEDIAVDSLRRAYMGLVEGQILRFSADGKSSEVFADTKGRPLCLEFDAAGRLIVADAKKGLLSLDEEGGIFTLVDGYKGQPFRFTNNLDIAADGKIYFSVASDVYGIEGWKDDMLAHTKSGRVFMYDPVRKHTQFLLGGLSFANGVALGPEDAYLLVNETSAYRIIKYWLKGPQAGNTEIFIENLPGFPDNLSFNEEGIFWVGMPNPRNDLLDMLLPYPLLRKVVKRLPEAVQPKPIRYGFVLGLNEKGKVVYNLQDPTGALASITCAKEVNGYLYLGSLIDPQWGRLKWPMP